LLGFDQYVRSASHYRRSFELSASSPVFAL